MYCNQSSYKKLQLATKYYCMLIPSGANFTENKPNLFLCCEITGEIVPGNVTNPVRKVNMGEKHFLLLTIYSKGYNQNLLTFIIIMVSLCSYL